MSGTFGQNRTTLTAKQERAALLLAEDERSDEQIAQAVGIARSTLALWKDRPEVMARIAEHRERLKDVALTAGFADKRARLLALNNTAQDLLRALAANGYEREEVKIAANGEHVTYRLFDHQRYAQFRGALDDIAKELGDRKTISETTHKFDPRKEAEAIAAEIGRPDLAPQIERDLLISQEAR